MPFLSCNQICIELGGAIRTLIGRYAGLLRARLELLGGVYPRAGSRTARFHDAPGSARETLACVEVAAALEHIAVPPKIACKMQQIIGP